MSYRNSFCTEYIYDEQDEKIVFDRLSQYWEVYCNSHIINGLIKNTFPLSTPWDLKGVLDGVVTNYPVTFVTISENGDYAHTDICVLKNGILYVNEFIDEIGNNIKEVVELVGAERMSGNIGGFTLKEESEKDNNLKESIYKLAHSVPLQTREYLDAKRRFETETDELIKAFAELDVALTDDNGEYRSTADVLSDLAEK